jgi:soluble lytic murein transglycosylase
VRCSSIWRRDHVEACRPPRPRPHRLRRPAGGDRDDPLHAARWYERLWHPLRYQEIVVGHARNYRLDPALLAAVIYQESKFHADARSDRGAVGLMQLLPETARGIAARTGGSRFRVSDLYDPEINVRYGSWYLRHLLDKYGSERLALAAYNAGQANVDRWQARGLTIQFPETRDFVDRVQSLKRTYDTPTHRFDNKKTLDRRSCDVIMTSRCSWKPTFRHSRPSCPRWRASATSRSRRRPTG